MAFPADIYAEEKLKTIYLLRYTVLDVWVMRGIMQNEKKVAEFIIRGETCFVDAMILHIKHINGMEKKASLYVTVGDVWIIL